MGSNGRALNRFSDDVENCSLVLVHRLCHTLVLLALVIANEVSDVRRPWKPFIINPVVNNSLQVEVSQPFIH
jgi:hypothetical protein